MKGKAQTYDKELKQLEFLFKAFVQQAAVSSNKLNQCMFIKLIKL